MRKDENRNSSITRCTRKKDDPGDCFYRIVRGKSTGRAGLIGSFGGGISEKQDQRGDRMEILPENAGYAAGPGHENEELEWGKKNIPYEPEIRFADRVTALHDIPKAPGTGMPKRRANRKAKRVDPGADRDPAHCALAREMQERQEELAEALLALINDLQYRVDRLENRRYTPAGTPPATRSVEQG